MEVGQLRESFKALGRCPEGLTGSNLEEHPLLLQVLESGTLEDAAEELRAIVRSLDGENVRAARNALAIDIENPEMSVEERRRRALASEPGRAAEFSMTKRNLYRLEKKGYDEIAAEILARWGQRQTLRPCEVSDNSSSPTPRSEPAGNWVVTSIVGALMLPLLSWACYAGITSTAVEAKQSVPPIPQSSVTTAPDGSTVNTHGWGPARKTFTAQSPAPSPVFNSMTSNPDFGDERNFLQCRDKKGGGWGDLIPANEGHTYQCVIWFDNNVTPNLNNAAAQLVNARVRAQGPLAATRNPTVVGVLSADNAATVWDSCVFTSPRPGRLTYVENSARMITNSANGVPLAETRKEGVMASGLIVGSGALLGSRQDGLLRQDAGYVIFDLTVSLE